MSYQSFVTKKHQSPMRLNGALSLIRDLKVWFCDRWIQHESPCSVKGGGRRISIDHEFHEIHHSVTFYFMKNKDSKRCMKKRLQTMPRHHNAELHLLSSLVWIDQYNECNGKTSFMKFRCCFFFIDKNYKIDRYDQINTNKLILFN